MDTRKKLLYAASIAALTFVTTTSECFGGSVLPGFDMTISAGGVADPGFDPGFGMVVVPGESYLFSGSYEPDSGLWQIDGYNVFINTDERSVLVNFGFRNNSSAPETYAIFVHAPVNPLAGSSLMSAVALASYNDANIDGAGGLTSSGPAFSGLIDDTSALTLLDDLDLSPDFAGDGDTAMESTPGHPNSDIPGPAIADSIGTLIEFTLSPGDSASFNVQFIVTPAPGALAALGLFGLLGTRRRRNR